MSIRIQNISKSWGSFQALKDISLNVNDGELVALLGPSGSGKTTLLRIVAGLEQANTGEIFLHDVNATRHHVRRRQVGFVFQHYAVFRHMSVFENIAFGLRVRSRKTRPAEAEIERRVQELLHLVHLEEYAQRMPDQLSGGQRQRVALARALAVEPKMLLLDEPFGALDARVRQELRRWLRTLQKELGLTTIIVTHDQEEAMEVADRIVIMNNGHLEQEGAPEVLWDRPGSPFVFDFLGHSNLLTGTASKGLAQLPGFVVETGNVPEGGRVRVGLRSFDIKVWLDRSSPCILKHISPFGDLMRLQVQLPDRSELTVQMPRRSSLLRGVAEGVNVHVEPTRAYLFPETAGEFQNEVVLLPDSRLTEHLQHTKGSALVES